jgi:hypothetical protein
MYLSRKIKPLSLLSLHIILLLISCPIATAIAADKDYQLFRSQENNFSIYFPNGWSIEKGRNPHVVVKSRSIDKIASIDITCVKNVGHKPITKSLSPKDMVKIYIDMGWDVRITDSGKTTFWNEEAIYVKFLTTLSHMGQTVKMIMWQIGFNHRNDLYSIGYGVSGTTDEIVNDNYNYYEPQFHKSLASFALDDWNK